MKKLLKWSAILGVVFCLIGVGMMTAGAMLGGVGNLLDEVRSYSGYKHHGLPDIETIPIEAETESAASEIVPAKGNTVGVPAGTPQTGNAAGTAPSPAPAGSPEDEAAGRFVNIRGLEIDMDCGEVYIREGAPGDEVIRLERSGVVSHDHRRYSVNREGDVLKIESGVRHHGMHWDDCKEILTITVPAGYRFRDVELELAAGVIEADVINADGLEISTAAGSVMVGGGEVGSLEVDCAAGSVTCLASASQKAEVDTATGTALIVLAGARGEYDYEIDCSVGTIVLEGTDFEEITNLSKTEYRNNGTGRKVELDCALGKITVRFPDES